jgi:hypothetical protein
MIQLLGMRMVQRVPALSSMGRRNVGVSVHQNGPLVLRGALHGVNQ